jgi:hypothetical protein
MMTQHDMQLLEEAKTLPWEDIEISKAETQEGRDALHAIAVRKYHYEEARCGMI